MRRILPLRAGLCVLLGAGAAPASASIQAYNEPQFTKTSANDAFFWHWVAVNGSDENGNTNYTYFLCFFTYRDGVTVESSNGTTGGPGSSNCTSSLRSGPSPSSGDFAGAPFTTGTVLEDGHTYQMCASAFYRWPYLPWKLDAANIGNCASTTIDRTKPNIGVFVNGTADYTNNPILQVRIDYQDATSPPWPGPGGTASNWVCVNRGAPCTPGGTPNAACSHAADPSSRTTSFTCTADVTAQADGDWNVCAMSADSAVPDNPSGTNQFAQATSNNANVSTPLCGHVVLDRFAPAVTVAASRTTVAVGDLVSFSAGATDAGSGPAGTYDWDFGDNTAHGSGAAVTHTYTQAGTYVAKASTTDRAGNAGSAPTTITVTAPAPPPAGGGTTTTPGGTTTTPGGTTTTPGGTITTPGGTTTTPGGGGTTTGSGGSGDPAVTAPSGPATPSSGGSAATTATAAGAGAVTTAPSAATISRQSGGGGTQRARVGGLGVVAPKRLTLSRTRTKLPLVLTVDGSGTVEVALLRGSSIATKGSVRIRRAGTVGFSLRLPKRPRPGRHTLKIVFRPSTGRAATRTLSLTFVAPRAPRAAPATLVGLPLAG